MLKKRSLANLPTRIQKLERISRELKGPEIYVKRDDETGLEFSGNKIRKLEFVAEDALSKGCNALITCGAVQSNHCRATAALGAKLGIPVFLVLKQNQEPDYIGNYLLDYLFGASITLITEEEYNHRRGNVMLRLRDQLEKKGLNPYLIPEGASNGLGCFGYAYAIEEILMQEKEFGRHFDRIVVATGSGSTLGGLILGKELFEHPGEMVGINITADAPTFQKRISLMLKQALEHIPNHQITKAVNSSGSHPIFAQQKINIIDGYVGDGYGKSTQMEWDFIKKIAQQEGLLLDPVYTGKAFYGLVQEIKKGSFDQDQRILFIHTGGIFGLIPPQGLQR